MKPTILIVDDEPGVRTSLTGVLRDEGYSVEAVASGEECLDRLTRAPVDLVVLDVWLPGMDGLATLARMRERQVDRQVVLISGHGNIESAVRAIKMGAFDFVEKPLSLEKTVLVVRNALRQRRLEAENRALRARVDRTQAMVGESYSMRQLREQVAMAAPTNGRVLIYGENGTGKELVARTIHALSRRRQATVRRSELRGDSRGADRERALRPRARRVHRRGRQTAAAKFEAADGGTIFLDEIGDMSLKTQAKVLRVLQEHTMEPRRRNVDHQGGRARARGHEQGSAGGDPRRPFPRGSVFPAERHPDLRPAAARAPGRHPAARGSLHGGVRARVRPARRRRSTRRRRCSCSATRGRATCASCAT